MVEVDTDHCRSSNPVYSKTGLPRTMTKKVFNIFKNGKYTSSLGLSTVTEKQVFLCVQKEFHVFWFMIIASCPATVYHWLKSSYVFFFFSSYVFIHIDKIPWAFLSPGCSVSALSASPHTTEASVPDLSSPSLDSLQYVLISLVQGSPKPDQSRHMCLTCIEWRGRLTTFGLLAALLLMYLFALDIVGSWAPCWPQEPQAPFCKTALQSVDP